MSPDDILTLIGIIVGGCILLYAAIKMGGKDNFTEDCN
jgi:hypothetical protein